MSKALAEADRVEIRGLCSFFVKEYIFYQGSNPMTGKRVQVPSKKLPLSELQKIGPQNFCNPFKISLSGSVIHTYSQKRYALTFHTDN